MIFGKNEKYLGKLLGFTYTVYYALRFAEIVFEIKKAETLGDRPFFIEKAFWRAQNAIVAQAGGLLLRT